MMVGKIEYLEMISSAKDVGLEYLRPTCNSKVGTLSKVKMRIEK
jgi:hypothetical protein